MTPSGTVWLCHRPLGFYSKSGLLSAALFIALIPVAFLAYVTFGDQGVTAALIACFACLAAGIQGLGVATLFTRFSAAASYSGMLSGMIVRMGLPLLLALALVVKSHPLLDVGFAYYLIAFYQVMLFVELTLIVPGANSAVEDPQGSSHGG